MPFTNTWDDTFPPDTQAANQIGADIRNFKVDIRQRVSSMSGADVSKPVLEAGFAGMVYFATDTHKIYQWSGGAWTDITTNILPSTQTLDTINGNPDLAINGNITVSKKLTVQTLGLEVVSGVSSFDDKITLKAGVTNDGGGFKHARAAIALPIATGSYSYQMGQASVTINWPTPFADTNYSVVASLVGGSTGTFIGTIVAKSAGSITITAFNVFNTISNGYIEVIAVHD